MHLVAIGIVIGVLWAYAPVAGYFVIVWWLERRARKKALNRLLAKVAVECSLTGNRH